MEKSALPLRASKQRLTRGWTFTGNSFSQNLMALGCGLSQINQGDKSRQYVVLDWDGGINTSDAGCAYALFPVDGEIVIPTGILSLPKDQHRVVVEKKALLSDNPFVDALSLSISLIILSGVKRALMALLKL